MGGMVNRLCKESISGIHGPPNTTGHCSFGCGYFVAQKVRLSFQEYKPEIDLAYEYFYDPDFGNNRLDNY